MFLSIGMLKQKYFLADIFILSAEKQPIKLSWRKIEWLQALRIVSLMPKWKLGRQAGKNRNVKFAFPVAFKPSVQNTN